MEIDRPPGRHPTSRSLVAGSQAVREGWHDGSTPSPLRRRVSLVSDRGVAGPQRAIGNLVRWYGIYTDIDDVKCSEHKIRQEEAYFRTITDTIRQIIVVLAPDGTTLYANRVALDQTGLTLDEVIDQGWFLGGPSIPTT